jgi:hypothetical protein
LCLPPWNTLQITNYEPTPFKIILKTLLREHSSREGVIPPWNDEVMPCVFLRAREFQNMPTANIPLEKRIS